MRKVFISIMLLMITLSINAQHMSFMGIPMGTHINNFKQSIISKGFKALSVTDAAPTCIVLMVVLLADIG